jgi:hypothetical protein
MGREGIHYKGVRLFGQPLAFLGKTSFLGKAGCTGDPCLSVSLGGGGEGGRLYPNPGIKRSRFPVQGSSPAERRLAWEGGTSEEA